MKRAIYARMEEVSFRSAVVTAAGVLAITGLGIGLTLTAGSGHRAAAAPLRPAAAATPEPAARLVGRGILAVGRALAVGQPGQRRAGSRRPAGHASAPGRAGVSGARTAQPLPRMAAPIQVGTAGALIQAWLVCTFRADTARTHRH